MGFRYARHQATEAIRQAARHRRQVFELDVLRELLIVLYDGSALVDGRALGLIRVMPDDFPLWQRLADARNGGAVEADLIAIMDEACVPSGQEYRV